MRRIRKITALSALLTGFSLVLFFLAFSVGNLLFVGGGVILFIISRFTRKPESYDEYRARYDEKYGISDQENIEE